MSKSDGMTDQELIESIKRGWIEYYCAEQEAWEDQFDRISVADEYMLSDWDEWLDRMEKAARARGLSLPARDDYINDWLAN